MQNTLERGEATPAATIHEKEDIIVEQGPAITEKSVEAGDSIPTSSTTVSDGGEAELRTAEHERSPTLAEWREGPHQVIERKTGPSGEVSLSFAPHHPSGNVDRFLPDPG